MQGWEFVEERGRDAQEISKVDVAWRRRSGD
jgi:hypothetical protein